MSNERSALGDVPKVDALLAHERIAPWYAVISRPFVKQAINRVLEEVRTAWREGAEPLPNEPEIIDRIVTACRRIGRWRLQRVLNGTGVMLHTNLGRSPVGPRAWREAGVVNIGNCNLEMNLADGRRGERFPFVLRLIEHLTGAEGAVLVNNNAAAVFLMLSAFARGSEVIVSRGELVQIGGGFRIPEILAESGATLVEVGTTNITTSEDYRRALTERTKMVLVVHPSNYRVRGFTSAPSLREIKRLLPDGVLLAVDEGCGQLTAPSPQDHTIPSQLKQGADLVAFSSDKLLGGVQGGFVVGRSDLVAAMRTHPLMRMFRTGKTIAALLESRLLELCNQSTPALPRPFTEEELATLKRRGKRILRAVDRSELELEPSFCTIGGGSHPDEEHPSWAIVFTNGSEAAHGILAKLRSATPPLIGRIRDDRVYIDLATIHEADTADLIGVLKSVMEA